MDSLPSTPTGNVSSPVPAQGTDPGDRPCYPPCPDSRPAGQVGSVTAVPPAVADPPAATSLSPFLRACRGIPGGPDDRVPVWFMRQAGRSLPEYRAVRGEGSILDAIRDPELSAEITLQPVRRYGVDAAILFSDIVVPVAAIGFGVDITPGVGPVVSEPFRTAA